MSVIGRLNDWRNERRIRRHRESCRLAIQLGERNLARQHWYGMVHAINARSPEQVARMERRMGALCPLA